MNKFILVGLVMALVACSDKSADQKVADQVSKVYPLNADERNMASINAKQFFEKEWLPAGGKRGQVINCRPTDSNYNGLVSCTGFIPQQDGLFAEVKRYCGYKPEVVGCSDEDTVK